VLNWRCDLSTDGKRGPSAAIMPLTVTLVLSALKMRCPFGSLLAGERLRRMKKSGTSAGEIRPMR